jgi:hypothetical protein
MFISLPLHVHTSQATAPVPSSVHQPSARLLCSNLPEEVTDDVLSVLFQQYVFLIFAATDHKLILVRYQGFQTTQVTWSPTANATGARVKMAQVLFESPELASVAKVALDGFTLKKGWVMSVVYT